MVKIVALVLGIALAGQEGGKIYAHKVFSHVGELGNVHVLVHPDGHLVNEPFVIQLRPECDQEKTDMNWRKLDIRASESVCMVDRSAIELNRMTQEIFVKVYEVDRDDFQKQLMSNPATAKAKCLKESTVIRFDLKGICGEP